MFAAMSCIATMSLTSCATILSGSANKIYIDGDVDEPVTIVTEKQGSVEKYWGVFLVS